MKGVTHILHFSSTACSSVTGLLLPEKETRNSGLAMLSESKKAQILGTTSSLCHTDPNPIDSLPVSSWHLYLLLNWRSAWGDAFCGETLANTTAFLCLFLLLDLNLKLSFSVFPEHRCWVSCSPRRACSFLKAGSSFQYFSFPLFLCPSNLLHPRALSSSVLRISQRVESSKFPCASTKLLCQIITFKS